MIITCPHCRTQFAVSLSAIPVQGKRVRCSRCSHIWHAERPKPKEDFHHPAFSEDLTPRQKLDDFLPKARPMPGPKKQVKVPASGGLILTTAVLIALALGSAALAFRHTLMPKIPAIAKLEALVGLHPTHAIGFTTFDILREREDNKLKFTLHADVTNTGSESLPMYPIQVRVMTRGGREMAKLQIDPPHDVLDAGQKITLTPEIARVSGSAASLIFDIGSPAEKLMR